MTREPAADDSSSWSAASAGHGAGEREELEAATHARCLSKWRGEEKKPELNGPIGASSSASFLFLYFLKTFLQKYIFNFTIYSFIPLPPGRGATETYM